MATSKGSKPAGSLGKRGGRVKWITLAVLTLAVVIAAQAGYVGFGWAHLKSMAFPRDESLLEYFPKDTGSVAILDPHQIDPKALGGESGVARTYLSRVREEIKKATGVDLFFDVDKLALTSDLVVARGRFDAKKLSAELAPARYVAAEHKGRSYLVRAGEDAIAVIDGGVLLYGPEEGIKAAIDAREGGASLAKNEQITERLRSVGWDHPLLVTARITDERPSIREILAGSTGPRAVTVGISTKVGLDLEATIESASPASAEELRKLLDEKRANADAWKPMVGSDAAQILIDVSKKASITSDPAQPFVKIKVHMEPAQLDALIKAAGSAAPLGELYKDFRLYQLLVPNL